MLISFALFKDDPTFAFRVEIRENGLSCNEELEHLGCAVMGGCGPDDHGGRRLMQKGQDVQVWNPLWIFPRNICQPQFLYDGLQGGQTGMAGSYEGEVQIGIKAIGVLDPC